MPPSIDFDPNVDFYKALGVEKTASGDEIKKAYRKAAKAYHPDSTGGDKAKESRFKDISNAYDVLGDAKKRQLYDDIRAGGGRGMSGGFPGGGGGFSYSTSSGGGPNVFDLNDLFAQFMGGNGGAGGARVRVEQTDRGRPRRGRAPVAEDAEHVTHIKASDGTFLRVEGHDLHCDARISWDRALLGTVATVATTDGKAEVKIPPGTSSGRKLRLRGKGMSQGRQAGDLYVTVQIDVPDGELDDELRKQVVQLAQRLIKSRKTS